MEKDGRRQEKRVFSMTLVIKDELVPCDVYLVQVGTDISFTRVCMHPGTDLQRNWDIDKEDYSDNPEDPNSQWRKKWVDIYLGFPGPMPEILGAAIDAKIRELEEEQNKNL